MKFKAIVLASVLVSASAMANSDIKNDIGISAASGEKVLINGQTFFKEKSFSLLRFLGFDSTAEVYAGDALIDEAGIETHKASGVILVRASQGQAKALANEYGLEVVSQAGSISVLKASTSTELLGLASKLEAKGVALQLELVNNAQQPE
ncbi:conserved hypothetical protein [Vibrio nigripulchritudo MADA3029]|uniref:hypothetical protein n=1 Tax=Vibrio nigripulchritudo TaxID=28173 RepID=UPI0003B19E61|nr:hypothetical protein [Vibrio nigripulchritudo]CCN47823.1 conserved hypothetical protein [Vibrio nigripulchritudo MADA3020]CCN55682.1 conserved hypothetical protein [Vibrio nigripulchritudo MADA3021]CCN62406.1 conserved hypothetical protein [Vibrio nigripulchritudo MADA3029]